MTPTEAVKAAIAAGAGSRAEIAQRSGLSRSLVDVVMDHLERTGELVRESLDSCAPGGCGNCAAHTGCSGAASNAGSDKNGPRGPVLLKLVHKRNLSAN